MITKIENGVILMTATLRDTIQKHEGKQVDIQIKRYYPKKDRSDEQPQSILTWTTSIPYQDGDTVIINGKRGVIHTEDWEDE
jgi:hypothetical protein